MIPTDSFGRARWIFSSDIYPSAYSFLVLSLLISFINFTGNADGKGDIRKEELLRACAILKVICYMIIKMRF
jgi:hypothetical protein